MYVIIECYKVTFLSKIFLDYYLYIGKFWKKTRDGVIVQVAMVFPSANEIFRNKLKKQIQECNYIIELLTHNTTSIRLQLNTY